MKWSECTFTCFIIFEHTRTSTFVCVSACAHWLWLSQRKKKTRGTNIVTHFGYQRVLRYSQRFLRLLRVGQLKISLNYCRQGRSDSIALSFIRNSWISCTLNPARLMSICGTRPKGFPAWRKSRRYLEWTSVDFFSLELLDACHFFLVARKKTIFWGTLWHCRFWPCLLKHRSRKPKVLSGASRRRFLRTESTKLFYFFVSNEVTFECRPKLLKFQSINLSVTGTIIPGGLGRIRDSYFSRGIRRYREQEEKEKNGIFSPWIRERIELNFMVHSKLVSACQGSSLLYINYEKKRKSIARKIM